MLFLGLRTQLPLAYDTTGIGVTWFPLGSGSGSCDAYSIINGTIAVLRSRQLKWSADDFLHHAMQLVPVLASHEADGIVNKQFIS